MIGMQCQRCKNYVGGRKCFAYKDEIHIKIWEGEHDHTKPFKGDGGIRFEPIKVQKKKGN